MASRVCCLILALVFPLRHAPAAAEEATSDRASTFLASTPSSQAATRAEQAASIASRLIDLRLDPVLPVLDEAPSSPEAADLKFRMAHHAFFHTSGQRYLDAMRQALETLQAAAAVDERHRKAWYRALVQARAFAEARTFRAHNDVGAAPPLPDRIIDLEPPVAGATAWALEDGNTLRRVPLAEHALSILVVSHPGCGFSRRAAADIEKDPALKRLFGSRTQWLAPQEANLDADAFRTWNEAHPSLPLLIVHDADELPQLTTWATPTFYFLREGKVIDMVVGWPTGGRREALLAAARASQETP